MSLWRHWLYHESSNGEPMQWCVPCLLTCCTRILYRPGHPSCFPQSAAAWRGPATSSRSSCPSSPLSPSPRRGRKWPQSENILAQWICSDYQHFRLKDDGDGLTGPQPSVIGSVDKVFKQVNKFDQYQCLQVVLKTLRIIFSHLFASENNLWVHGDGRRFCCQYDL